MPTLLQSLGPVVMMIDDTPFNRRHVQNFLSPFDLNFLEAQNGEQALRELYDLGFQVDLILCDIEMPKMDGIETVKRIRSEAPKIPIVMCSSRSDRESVLACAALGNAISGIVAIADRVAASDPRYAALDAKLKASGIARDKTGRPLYTPEQEEIMQQQINHKQMVQVWQHLNTI